MEKDMSEHSKRVEQTRDAVKERKKICLERGLVEQACIDCIRDVFSPLPVIAELASGSIDDNSVSTMFTPPQSEKGAEDDDDEDNDQELFITPKTPTYFPSFDDTPYSCPRSPLPLARTPRKRPRLAQSQSSRGQKKIPSFFLSQRN
ncbi:hypothetical protein OS493_015334 [Desmophyllum pertusum]|uniref:Uncharacterized protein n=1 Tax=Desmophyllum pertusum TaxID=174260 RepID=A0A9X0CXF9_9CNID|nr:hypothetical protein OS493_015334 [Desmophyllum pertusum]